MLSIGYMQNGRCEPKNARKPKTADRIQFNVRLPMELQKEIKKEIKRQGRWRDIVVARIFNHFLSMPSHDRDMICSRSA